MNRVRIGWAGMAGQLMTKKDDAPHIRSAKAEAEELRRPCMDGTDRYRQALVAAGYLTQIVGGLRRE